MHYDLLKILLNVVIFKTEVKLLIIFYFSVFSFKSNKFGIITF